MSSAANRAGVARPRGPRRPWAPRFRSEDACDPPGSCRATAERVARYVATLVYYHVDGGSWTASGQLLAEAADLCVWLSSGDEGSRPRVLALVESGLWVRYDEAVALRLHAALLRALDDAAAREAETPRLHRDA
jgi:hypothetical protein